MAKNKLTRKSLLISLLSELSKDGWKNAKSEDYIPLEHELHMIREQLK
jgi:hypothetical protein